MSQWSGLACPVATAARCAARLPEGAWAPGPGWSVSRLGWGSLPGEVKNIVDSKLERALEQVLAGGLNLLDTSPAYRHRRSQASVGRALQRALGRGLLRREELVVATHAGWLAFDRKEEEPAVLLEREILPATGLTREDLVGQVWSLHPAWLRHQLEMARRLCGLASFDLLMLDAPETGLKVWPRERWRAVLLNAFVACEELRGEGLIGAYGICSLEGFRAKAEGQSILDLAELLALARQAAGGGEHGLRALQLPYSLAALDLLNLRSGGRDLRHLAADEGVWLCGLLSLGQGQLTSGLPAYFRERMPGLSPAQQALQVVLSTEGLGAALVGMKSREHIEENLALLARPRLAAEAWTSLFKE
jgi:aryl-alcohol dehydrogenase-like predicted oxidoreductase